MAGINNPIPGKVVNDTHAAQLDGSYTPENHSYTPSSDTHNLAGSYTPEVHDYTPSSDDHSASLNGTLGASVDAEQTSEESVSFSVDDPGMTAASGSSEQVLLTATAPTNSKTKKVAIHVCAVVNNSGSRFVRIRRGNSTGGTQLLVFEEFGNFRHVAFLSVVDDSPGTSGQSYVFTAEDSSLDEFMIVMFFTVINDDHAAQLDGSYTPEVHDYTPSSDTHALGGSYTPEDHSYTPSSDDHSASLTGSEGSCEL